MLTSRQRIQMALNHEQPDKTPLDLGSAPTTGMHASSVYLLRQALKLDPPGTPIKVIEPYQILGEIKPDLAEALGVDVVGVWPINGLFGFANEGWKPWTLFDGTPVLVPEAFNTEPEPDGSIFMYPEGDRSAPPSGHMPNDGFYFDTIIRQPPVDDGHLNPEDNLQEFGAIGEADVRHFEQEVKRQYESTDKAILMNAGGTAFGDIALVPVPWVKHPRGIRDVEEWYVSLLTRRDYIYEVFERQCEIALSNLQKIAPVVGDRVAAIYMTGTDFGMQTAPFLSPATYRDLFYPFHKALNDWVHENTSWKCFMHSDGALIDLLPGFIDAGFDILNPVQWTAKGMDRYTLKARFGESLVFWGAVVDTQRTLPFGTPDEIRAEVRENIEIFSPGGGYVINTVHNVQPGIPVENLLALYQSIAEYR
ncbi:MAG: hypothetical protein J5I90_01945 [Caldilineales bacterium]|nr:hypothetical protein [Caldilineales bacterium]